MAKTEQEQHEWIWNELYQELMQWHTDKLYSVFSRDNGKTLSTQRIYHFITDFVRGTRMESWWKHSAMFDNFKQEWVEMFRWIKKQAIARELKVLGRVLADP